MLGKLLRPSRLDRLTPMPVPFRHTPMPDGFVETRSATARLAILLLLTFFVFIAVPGMIAFAVGELLVGLGFSGIALVLGAIFGAQLWSSRVRRGLVYDSSARQLVIIQTNGKRQPVEEARADHGEFMIHPVDLAIAHSRSGQPTMFWTGFAAAVHVGTSRFVLACDKRKEPLREYSQTLPSWVPSLNDEDGPPIEADAHRRIL